MRHAPSVRYPIERTRAERLIFLIILVISACVVAVYCYQNSSSLWRSIGVVLTWLVAGAAAGWTLSRPLSGDLQWDGAGWTLQERGGWTHATVVFDGQSALLLRLSAPQVDRSACWVWLQRSSAPERWLALRRAAHDQSARLEQATSSTRSSGGFFS